jgi:hypothetical protein
MANVVCGILGANTGKPQCDVPIAAIKYGLPTRGCEFTEAELTDSSTIKAAMLAKMLLAKTDNQKLFLIPYANEAEDNTGDPNIGTLSDGFEEPLSDALPKYILRHAKMGVKQNQAICVFNGWGDKYYFIDRNNRFCYIVKSDNGSKGFSVGNLYYDPPRPGSSNAVKTTIGRITFANADEFKSSVIGMIDLDFNPADLVNIEDINIVQKAAPASNVVTIGGLSRFGQVDIYANFKTALNNVARWQVINESTGASMTKTSVATDDGNKGWDLTIDSTEFTALPSGAKYSVNLVSPATLALAGVYGIEGIKITFTKP